jgi:Bacterial PH domain
VRVVIRLRSRWLVLGVFAGLGVYALAHYDLRADGYVWAALALIPIVVAFRMRVAADDSGVTIVNFGWPMRLPWPEIDGFGMRTGQNHCLEVRTRHGRRVRGRALSTTGIAAYSEGQAQAVVDELRRRQAQANGETTEAADARAIEEALSAAEARNYVPFWDLAGDFRVAPEELWRRVDELAAQGRIDEGALRSSGPQLSRPVKWYLARKHPELLDDAD